VWGVSCQEPNAAADGFLPAHSFQQPAANTPQCPPAPCNLQPGASYRGRQQHTGKGGPPETCNLHPDPSGPLLPHTTPHHAKAGGLLGLPHHTHKGTHRVPPPQLLPWGLVPQVTLPRHHTHPPHTRGTTSEDQSSLLHAHGCRHGVHAGDGQPKSGVQYNKQPKWALGLCCRLPFTHHRRTCSV
jgi:hypothetical protein